MERQVWAEADLEPFQRYVGLMIGAAMPCIPSSGCLAGLWGRTPRARQTAIMNKEGGETASTGMSMLVGCVPRPCTS